MGYTNIREMLEGAQKGGYAIGAFNIVNYLTACAVVDAAQQLKTPVILQTSVSVIKKIGLKPLIDMLRPMAERADVPVAIHLDHSDNVDLIKACIDSGWSSVMVDGSRRSFEENVRLTKQIREYARTRNVTVEGGLGAIESVEDVAVAHKRKGLFADPAKSLIFMERTGIDAFAPAIGTYHGLYSVQPEIDFDRLMQINDLKRTFLVIHGGTGLTGETCRRLIASGASKINVSTAIKIAYIEAFREYLGNYPNQYNPLISDAFVLEKVINVAKEYMGKFNSVNVV